MFSTGYVVLLVDDEPDVLEISKLAMKSFSVCGLPVKLYTLTKTGARQYEVLSTGRAILELINAMVAAGSRDDMAGILNWIIESLSTDATGEGNQLVDPRVCFVIDGEIVAKHPSLTDIEIMNAWHSLDQHHGVPLNGQGDKYVVDADQFLLKVQEKSVRAEVGYIAHVPGEIPETFPAQMYGLAQPIATLWRRA